MAKVAVAGSLSSASFPFERGTSMVRSGGSMKRKTPSELREEQLKRRTCAASTDESAASLLVSEKNAGVFRRVKKPETSKVPRYIDTRVDEVYPVKKSSDMFRMACGKEKAKDKLSSEPSISLKNPSVAHTFDGENQPQFACPDSSAVLASSSKDSMAQSCKMTEKQSQNTFLSVAELSQGREWSSGLPVVNMEVLKRLGAREPPVTSPSPDVSSVRFGDIPSVYSGNFSSEFHVPGPMSPLDLTLKTTMRLVSSSSVKWCHRLTTSSNCNGMAQFTPLFGFPGNQDTCPPLGPKPTATELFSKSLHSWVFPQSCLPPSVISALNLSAAQGETDFLLKRQLAWEDSFRSLYYRLRKNICNLFYVCTSKFVVMFVANNCLGKAKRSCNAYVSQSTGGLRSLLREHDICFSMPLCHSEAEQATAEDLVELSEIEKRNLGYAHRRGSTFDLDNSPQSLLAFSGNENVHGLYDFLLNYRSFYSSLTGVDVPSLYSPVPFENASLSVPEVKCKEIKRADAVQVLSRGSHLEDVELGKDSFNGLSYSIEIKDSVLPPWTICGLCASMSSECTSFDACFTTEPSSVGLNVALDTISRKPVAPDARTESSDENCYTFGVPGSVVTPSLRSATLKGLKFCNGSYTASASLA